MKAYACPACGEPTIGFWQKHTLGPARSITCRNCKARVSVSWLASTAMFVLGSIAQVLGGVAAISLPLLPGISGLAQFMLGVLVASALWLWLYDRVVGLVAR
jgi:hypothetical protein